jgi:plasmid stabilization system protein ParE
MDYVLAFRPEVRDELDDAYNWYENQQFGLGDEFLGCVNEQLRRICKSPEAYLVVHRDVRRVIIQRFPYTVCYRIVSSRIIVIAIFHNRRDSKAWKKRT